MFSSLSHRILSRSCAWGRRPLTLFGETTRLWCGCGVESHLFRTEGQVRSNFLLLRSWPRPSQRWRVKWVRRILYPGWTPCYGVEMGWIEVRRVVLEGESLEALNKDPLISPSLGSVFQSKFLSGFGHRERQRLTAVWIEPGMRLPGDGTVGTQTQFVHVLVPFLAYG